MKEATKNWFTLADKELKLAEFSLKANEPIGVIYHLHASIEKLLKGIYEETKGNPPKIHSLKKLAVDCCSLNLQQKELKLLNILDKAFIDSRYPDDISSFESKYNISNCIDLIKETKDSVKCLKSLLIKN
ncbi:MAG: HEPN domain-containing protein [Candidatus Melainabacteria bacterium]|nr:HEPN domain-containing protein [Candidatus Melainabacteria bacterium]